MSVDPTAMMALLGQNPYMTGQGAAGNGVPVPGMGTPMNFPAMNNSLNMPGMGGNPVASGSQSAQPTSGLSAQQKMMMAQALMQMSQHPSGGQIPAMQLMQGRNTG
jgi:hypothetical protein